MLGGVLALILFSPMLSQMVSAPSAAIPAPGRSAAATPVAAVKQWENPLWTIAEVARPGTTLGFVGAMAVPAALVLMAIGGTSIARRHPLLVACYVIHIPLTLALLVLAGFRVWPRYFFVDAGFAFVAMTAGVFWITDRMARLVASRPGGERHRPCWPGWPPWPWPWLRRPCCPRTTPCRSRTSRAPSGSCWPIASRRTPWPPTASPPCRSIATTRLDWAVVEDRAALQQLVDRPGRVWLIEAFPEHAATRYPDIHQALGSEFRAGEEVPWHPGGRPGHRLPLQILTVAPLRVALVTTFYPPLYLGGDGQPSARLARPGPARMRGRGDPRRRRLERAVRPRPHDAAAPRSRLNRPASPCIGWRASTLWPRPSDPAARPAGDARQEIEAILAKGFDVIHYHNVSQVGGPGVWALGEAIKLYTAHEHWLVCPNHVWWRHNRELCTAASA